MQDVPAGAITAVIPLANRGVAVAGRYRGRVDLGQGLLDSANNAFVAVFDAQGQIQWSQTFATGLAAWVDHGRDPGLALAPDGDLMMNLSGFERADLDAVRDFGWLVRLSATGQRRWERRWTTTIIASQVATDGAAWIATAGDLVRLDASGTEVTRTKLEALGPTQLRLDPAGGLYVLGIAEQKLAPSTTTFAVERRSLQGERVWRRTFGGPDQPYMHMSTSENGERLAIIGRSIGPIDWGGEGALADDKGSGFQFLYVVGRDGRLEGKSLLGDVAWADDVAWVAESVLVLGNPGEVSREQQSLNLVGFDRRGSKTSLTRFLNFVDARGQIGVRGEDVFVAGTSDTRQTPDSGECFQPRPFAFRIIPTGMADAGFAPVRP